MISSTDRAEILRLHFAEKWPIGTIATHLGCHHSTVKRVIEQNGLPPAPPVRSSIVDAFVTFILGVLARFPRVPASRLYQMARDRGYRGGPDHFRHKVAELRPRPPAEAFLRLRTLPGEQAQVDWAHFGAMKIGRAVRPLMAFVMVLSYSRAISLRFFLGQVSENFLRGHAGAFADWGGVPRTLLYDNLKSAVIERQGDAIHFNQRLLDFAGHHRFLPRPVAVARGNQKGRVERAISYVRQSFWPARVYRDLDDLNHQALLWCQGTAMDRRWQDDDRRTVRDALAEEAPMLLPLPATDFPTDERRECNIGKTPYVRFDANDYSVPHALVRRTVVVHASLVQVRVLADGKVVAAHQRSYDRGQQIEDPSHIDGLKVEKAEARRHRGINRLVAAAPSAQLLLVLLAEKGANLGNATMKLLQILDAYGGALMEPAICEAIEKGTPHPHAVRQILDQYQHRKGLAPPIPVQLPDDQRVRDLSVRTHSLSGYDQLCTPAKEEDDDAQGATVRVS